MAEKIEYILNEVLKTEIDYVKDLNTIIDVFKKPLQDKGIITSEQSKALFANVEDIKELNIHEMRDPIEARFNECKAQGRPVSSIRLGDIFINLSEHLKGYTEYCANQPKAIALINTLNTSNDDFFAFDQGLMNNDPRVRGLNLLAFVVKPTQRLCKYPLLLRELISQTDPSSEEHQLLNIAFGKVSEAVAYVNEIQRQEDAKAQDKLNQMIQIEQSIDGAEELQLSADVNRYIVKMGEITRFVFKKKPYICTMILFNNYIVVSKPKDDKKKPTGDKKKAYKPFTLEFAVKIDQCAITDLADTLDHSIVNAFELRNKTTNAGVTLCSSNIEDKRLWIKDIRLYIKDFQKMQATKLRNQHSQRNLTGSVDINKTVGSVITSSWGMRSGSNAPPPKFGSTSDLSSLLKREEDDAGEEEANQLAQELLSSTPGPSTPGLDALSSSPHMGTSLTGSHGPHASDGESTPGTPPPVSLPAPTRGTTRNDDLLWACALGDLENARGLVVAGFDPNELNYDFRAPLHLAAVQGHLEIVKYLVEECGVAVAPRDRWGNTPSNDASNAGHSYVAQFLKFAESQKPNNGRLSSDVSKDDPKKKSSLSSLASGIGGLAAKAKNLATMEVKINSANKRSSDRPGLDIGRKSSYGSGGDPLNSNLSATPPSPSTSSPNLAMPTPVSSLVPPLGMTSSVGSAATSPDFPANDEPISPRRRNMTVGNPTTTSPSVASKASVPPSTPGRTVVPGVRAPGVGSVAPAVQVRSSAPGPAQPLPASPPPEPAPTPVPVTGNSRSGFLVRLAWNEEQRAMMWSPPIWCSVKNGFFFTFASKDNQQPQSRASILGKGSLPSNQTDLMMLDRIPKLKTDVFPFLLKTSDAAEPIFLAAPTNDSRQAWLQTVANWVDGPKIMSSDAPPEDPAGNVSAPAGTNPGTPGTPVRAPISRNGSTVQSTPSTPLGHARTSSVGSSQLGTPTPAGVNPNPPQSPAGQPQAQPAGPNPMLASRAYQNGVQWLIGTPQGPQIKWSSYDPETNDIIEDAFQLGQPEVLLTHGVFARGTSGYVISFTQMTQTNSANGASRQIKRMVRKQ